MMVSHSNKVVEHYRSVRFVLFLKHQLWRSRTLALYGQIDYFSKNLGVGKWWEKFNLGVEYPWPLCCFKLVWLFFPCRTEKRCIWKNLYI